MKNIVFLDVDGVLNDNNSNFLLENVNVLKQLVNTYNAKVVMISSQQMNGTQNIRNKIINELNKFGICNIDFIDPNFEGYLDNIPLPARLLGIIDYLKNNDIAKYVILDDDYHNDYKMVCLNHYKTSSLQGLTYNDLPKITFKPVNLNNFKYISYKYRKLGEYEMATNKLIKVLKKISFNKIH